MSGGRRRRKEGRPYFMAAAAMSSRMPGLMLVLSIFFTFMLQEHLFSLAEEQGDTMKQMAAELDGHYENQTLTRVAFGSCNKQVSLY